MYSISNKTHSQVRLPQAELGYMLSTHTHTLSSQGQSQLVGTTKKSAKTKQKTHRKKARKALCAVRYMFNILIQPLFWEVWLNGGTVLEWGSAVYQGWEGRQHLTPIWQDAKLAAINYSPLSWSCAGAWHLNGARIYATMMSASQYEYLALAIWMRMNKITIQRAFN